MPGFESLSHPELEAAILQAPDSADAYLVYGDWLQRQGHPRGELIALQHALSQASGEEATKLKQQISTFLEEHQDVLLGELAEATDVAELEDDLQVEWHLGFIRSARVGQKDGHSGRDIAELVKALLAHPSARFLRDLTLGVATFDAQNDYTRTIRALTEGLSRQDGPKTLRSLFIGDFAYPQERELSWPHLGDVSGLLKLLPGLRSLRLRGGELELGHLDLPELRELTVETGGLPLPAVRSIAAAKWPKLEKLEVWFGSGDYGAGGGEEELQPLLDGGSLPRVTRLGLRNAEFTDALCRLLPKAKVLPRLKVLDLSLGTLSDEGARVLAEHAPAFAHLEHLDLARNTLSAEGQALVAGLCPSVNLQKQRAFDEEDYRYVAVGE